MPVIRVFRQSCCFKFDSLKLGSRITTPARNYATRYERDYPSPLSQSLDTRQHVPLRGDSVGPFRLGVTQQSLAEGEKIRKWSELSAGGKVMRTTARTTNLTVILLGAGLSALLIYSLTSELFSKNSPTVLYNDACERIKASSKVMKYLNEPLAFHNNPPSVIRPRHRNRHVTSQIMEDSYGNEHMILTFYVQGRPPGSKPTNNESTLESVANWVQDKATVLSDASADDAKTWVEDWATHVWEKSKRAFRYLSGAPVPVSPIIVPTISSTPETSKDAGGAWSFAGMFSSLRGSKEGPAGPPASPDGRMWTDGEVHADLIRNNEGYFVFRYLLVDIPNSRDRNSVRVFVEKSPGVRENEPVMRWNS
ncbi:TIM21-domain-containing protein [Infundibulicybe gibba]|nr:TIM21-domain-containing protein [Infundibulicybe gibba]